MINDLRMVFTRQIQMSEKRHFVYTDLIEGNTKNI